ncbi:MAG: ABC transporter ATP-binding protein [Desulfobacterales bacterium]|nr:ABC transporter ATP-binding protein [Desulfobacterales bacterium]
MTEPVYRIRNLIRRYNGQTALGVDGLDLAPATITGLIGPNGSGKSTLLGLLAFVDRPSEGEILYQGQPARPFSPEIRFQVTLLTQEPYLLKRSVFDNIAYGLKLRKETDRIRQRVFAAMEGVGLLPESFCHRHWYELSGGEAQRVALAARLVLRPRVLLLDEPTASIDAESAQRIKEAALEARDRWGTTLVIASHDWQWLYEVCDSVLHLDGGRVFGDGAVNMIRGGDWIQKSTGLMALCLADGQRIEAAAPAGGEIAAFVPADALQLKAEGAASPHGLPNVLTGTVSRMLLERSTGRIVVTVLVGGLVFNLKTGQDDVRTLQLFPGQPVTVSFAPGAVQWM